MNGDVSKEVFLDELKFKNPMHQICFCTIAFLQMLSLTEKTNDSKILQIDDLIVEQLMIDYRVDEGKAIDMFYNSNIFTQLSDERTKLYLKSWQEIYELLKSEFS